MKRIGVVFLVSAKLLNSMQSIQTICPKCQKHYFVSAIHLNIARGNVCCSQCHTEFNAYQYIYQKQEPLTQPIPKNTVEGCKNDIFKLKADQSSIDLQTYLNNHHYFKTTLQLSTPTAIKTKKKTIDLFWLKFLLSVISLLLCCLISLHFFIYNLPVNQNSFLASFITSQSQHFKPLTHESELEIEILQTTSTYPNTITILGHLVNYNPHAVKFPNIQLILNKTKTRKKTFLYSPEVYLPYFFKQKTILQPNQSMDFRIDIAESNQNYHSIEVKIDKSI